MRIGSNKKYIIDSGDRKNKNLRLMTGWLDWRNKGKALEVLVNYNELGLPRKNKVHRQTIRQLVTQ